MLVFQVGNVEFTSRCQRDNAVKDSSSSLAAGFQYTRAEAMSLLNMRWILPVPLASFTSDPRDLKNLRSLAFSICLVCDLNHFNQHIISAPLNSPHSADFCLQGIVRRSISQCEWSFSFTCTVRVWGDAVIQDKLLSRKWKTRGRFSRSTRTLHLCDKW